MSAGDWVFAGFLGATALCYALLWWGKRALERDTRRTREWAEWERRFRG